MNNLVKIKSFKVRLYGERGLCVTIPSVWTIRHGVEPSDEIGFYQAPNSDDLILRLDKITCDEEIRKTKKKRSKL